VKWCDDCTIFCFSRRIAQHFQNSLTGLEPNRSIKDQFIAFGSALRRVETLLRHLNPEQRVGSDPENLKLALVPIRGTKLYNDWLAILLNNRSSLGSFLQAWLRELSDDSIGGSSARRIRVIASHLSAAPYVVNAD
jgi:hypothetical protein